MLCPAGKRPQRWFLKCWSSAVGYDSGMGALPASILQYGSEQPLPVAHELRAGPLLMLLEEGGIRYLRLGRIEILRRIYVAVRDRNWLTAPTVLSNLKLGAQDDHFAVSFDARCLLGKVDFAWKGAITGAADGTVTFRMDGEARTSFFKNRIGICVLHPILECAGRPCRIEHTDGSLEEGSFPRLISPQQPFKKIAAITHHVAAGLSAEVRLEGEVFEMEDQRNWTDASFKTYSTPLDAPFPVEVEAGTKISHKVTLTLKGRAPRIAPPPKQITLTVGQPSDHALSLPALGLGAALSESHSERQIRRLRALGPEHLRIDVDLKSSGWETEVTNAARIAAMIRAGLLVAFRPAEETLLRKLRARLVSLGTRVSGVLVLNPATEKEAMQPWIYFACDGYDELSATWMFNGSGTTAYFAHLNRSRMLSWPWSSHTVFYSANPQVHAFDQRTLVECLSGLAETLITAHARGGQKMVAVSPVTLRPRFNPSATAPAEQASADELPSSVDVRQMSLFGAGWTLGSLKYLSEQRAGMLTYYETVGWRGVMESEVGSPLPRTFHSIAGSVFPLYHVLADFSEFSGERWRNSVIHSLSSDPLSAEIFAFRNEARIRVLAANLTPKPVTATIHGLPEQVRLRRLNQTNAEFAMAFPEDYRSREDAPQTTSRGTLEVEFLPFEVVRLDSI